MCSERSRAPQDPDYFHAVGLAVVAFARLEWDAVWCCARLQQDYLDTIEPSDPSRRGKTAGAIGKDLHRLFRRISDQDLRNRVVPFAEEFKLIVDERNALMHGKPGTAPNGDQRLFRHGSEWTIDKVNAFSDRCVRAGEPLNALLHNELSEPCGIPLDDFASV